MGFPTEEFRLGISERGGQQLPLSRAMTAWLFRDSYTESDVTAIGAQNAAVKLYLIVVAKNEK